MRHHTHAVRHHAHLVERWLAVEEDVIAVDQVPLDDVPVLEDERLAVIALEADRPVALADVLGTGVYVRAVADEAVHVVDVERVDHLWKGQVHRDAQGNTELVDADVGVGSDDRPRREVHAFAHEVPANAPLLPVQAIANGPEDASGPVLGDVGSRVVDEGRDVLLQRDDVPLDRVVRCALLDLQFDQVVELDDVPQLVRQVILLADAGVVSDRRADAWRGHREHRAYHPLGAVVLGAKSKRIGVLVRDALQDAQDIVRAVDLTADLLRVIAVSIREVLPLHEDLRRIRPGDTVGLTRPASVDRLLAAALDVGAYLVHGVPALHATVLLVQDDLDGRVLEVDEDLAAPEAHATEELLDDVEELDVEDGPRHLDVAEMSGAEGVPLLAGLAYLVIIDDAHAGIKEAVHDGFVDRVRVRLGDLGDRALAHLLRSQNAELNALDP